MPTTIDSLMNSKGAMIVLAVIAFLLAAVLVLVIVRMLLGGRLRMPGGRARQARLGIVDAFDLDRQRQLIIVRRDNTEHLIMIGGPNDVLIESEIVRVEARDFRDGRRERGADLAPPAALAVDARIPAPFAAADRPEAQNGAGRPADMSSRGTAEEPMLPMTLPQLAPEPPPVVLEPSQAVPRTPTFPLPPRRPAPPPAERRSPPQLPESASRTEPSMTAPPPLDPPPPLAPPLAVAPAVAPVPEPVASEPPPPPPVEITPVDAPPPPPSDVVPPPVRQQPSFLKPLPPRPPIRPLRRVTPQAVPPAGSPAEPAILQAPPPPAAPPPEAPAPAPTPVEPPPQAVAPPAESPQQEAPHPEPHPAEPPPAPLAPPPPAPPQPAATSKDALESLEEEMAKLLGRGSS